MESLTVLVLVLGGALVALLIAALGTRYSTRRLVESAAHRARGDGTEQARRRMARLLEHSFDLLLELDARGTVKAASRTTQRLLGKHAKPGTAAVRLVHPDDADAMRKHLDRALIRVGVGTPFTARVVDAAGEWQHYELVLRNLLGDPDVAAVVLHARDVSDRVTLATRLRDAEERIRTIEEALRASESTVRSIVADADGVLTLDEHGDVVDFNRGAERTFGYRSSEVLGRHLAALAPESERRRYREILAELRPTTPGAPATGTFRMNALCKDGELLPIELFVARVEGPDGTFHTAIVRDVSETVEHEARLAHQAMHDPLTGLPNRSLLFDRVEQAIGRGNRDHRPPALFFLDLDRFKQVNDTLGHQAGDQLLVVVARRLEGALRPTDTVARLGGDEFVVLCDGLPDEAETQYIAERIGAAMRKPVKLGEQEVTVSASVGIAFARPGSSAQSLLADADAAMYAAKSGGRDHFVVFDPPRHAPQSPGTTPAPAPGAEPADAGRD